MNSDDYKKVLTTDFDEDVERQLFSAARQLEGNSREEYLNQSCGANRKLHQRIVKLLDACEKDSGLLDRDFKSVYFELSGSSESKRGSNQSNLEEILALFEPTCDSNDSLGRVAHFEISDLIGRGAFGVVFQAFDEKLERRVAIKVLAPSLSTIPEYRERFLKEARAAASIQHPNVVKIHSVEESPFPFIVMELVDGETLQSRIKRKGPLPTAEVLEVSTQVIQGLAAAHKNGIVHLDVKPSNILLSRDSEDKLSAKLTDFGLALIIDAEGQVVPESVLGTPAYMSPEQARGEKIDQRADLFSFGSVIFAMCSGHAAFSGGETLSIMRGVMEAERVELPDGVRISRGVSGIINRLHSTLPEGRYRSADEVLRDLKRLSGSSLKRSLLWIKYTAAALFVVSMFVLGINFLLTEANSDIAKANRTRAQQQLFDVTTELKEVDELFDVDRCKHTIKDGKITFVHLPFAHDLSALRKLSDVEHLRLEPPGEAREVPVSLSFLDGMKELRNLELFSFPAQSLEPLRGHKLEKLQLWYSRINAQTYPAPVDLSTLKGMPLHWLNCGGCGIDSFESLRGMNLEFLCASFSTPVSDLSPLDGMPLHTLLLANTNVSDISPLKDMNLKIVELSGSKVRDLSPLVDMSLQVLKIKNMHIDDLDVLKKCKIKALWMDYDPSHEELVRSIPKLERLNGKPLAQFLQASAEQ